MNREDADRDGGKTLVTETRCRAGGRLAAQAKASESWSTTAGWSCCKCRSRACGRITNRELLPEAVMSVRTAGWPAGPFADRGPARRQRPHLPDRLAVGPAGGGRVLLRIEDIDSPRVKPGAAEQACDDLRWLGLDWDGEPIVQTQRLAALRGGPAAAARAGTGLSLHLHAHRRRAGRQRPARRA